MKQLSLYIGICISLLFSNLLFASSYYQFSEKVNVEKESYNLAGKDDSYRLSTYLYKQNNEDKIFILFHGYVDNCGYMKHISSFLWQKGYSILCVELPGHGGSSGERAQVDSFQTYGHILHRIVSPLKEKYKEVNILAHSTGAVVFLEGLFISNSFSDLKKVILLSPLIRTKHWTIAKIGHVLLQPFIEKIPRRNKDNPIYRRFNLIAKQDPHYIDQISLLWFSQLRTWYSLRIENNSKNFQQAPYVLFGSEDEVIDVEFNRDFYKKSFPNAKIFTIEGAHHHLDFEEEKLDQEFYQILDQILE